GIKTAEKGKFTIALDELKNIPANFEIYLKDSITKIRHDLRKSDFIAKTDSIGAINNRYFLVFLDKKTITIREPEIENTGIEVFYTHNDHRINIKNPKLLPIKKAVLYNLTGEKLKVFEKIPLQKWVKLPIRQNTIGVYIMKLMLEKGFVSIQFIVE
ncbi:MAG TPA: hypothetical protein VFI78_06360, partial [Salinimicrobium sp.]|nr:hypothetical protein [Salinimicrobium sp.]